MRDNKDSTHVQEVDLDLDAVLNGGVDADNVMLAGEKEKPEKMPSIFSRKQVDVSFLDNAPSNEEEEEEEEDPKAADPKGEGDNKDPKKPKVSAEEIADIVNIGENSDEDGDDPESAADEKKKIGRAGGLVELTNKLIEKKLLVPFDDDKPIDKYTLQDFEDLFQANSEEREKELQKEVPARFFDALPDELKYAAKYVADGGADLKGLFKHLARVEEVKDLDISTEAGQEQIIREYLTATHSDWTPEEIEEEVTEYKDREELEAKANKFKPKLDSMQEQILSQRLKKQEDLRAAQQEQSELYMENVYNVLATGELNGIKLDKKVQTALYSGLIKPNYPSMSGRNTNLLGHLLEKYQFKEPRHDLIAEALYLLSDPEGYRAKVRENEKKEVVAKTVRALKTEEGRKIASGGQEEAEDKGTSRKIPRPSKQFFKR